ncbi:MAG TPA: TPM domain-containing protein [Candidatus Acidoferrales bacterium]|jgi:putative membrane protein|nr:TPM domain-containing protein [Candidatus Acidoferrales bacterium]
MIRSLTDAERRRIDTAIREIGHSTSAHLAVVVVPASDRYSLYPLVWGQLGALLIVAIVALFRPGLGIRTSLLVQLPTMIVLTLLFDWLPIRIALVPKVIQQSHARQLAHREFDARVVHGSHRNRVLFFVSLSERYVEVIADRGVHSLVADGTWDKIVAEFLATVRAGRVADGVLDAIAGCGAILKEHHPASGAS